MTQAAAPPWTFYVANGVTTTFSYGWRVASASEIEAYLDGVLVTNYSVTGIGNVTGGSLIFSPAPVAGSLFLRRVTPQTQETDYVLNDSFGAESHEAALDKLTRMVQDIYERLSRSPRFGVTIANALRDMAIPQPQALKVLGFDATGTMLTLFDSALLQITVDPVSNLAFGKTVQTLTASTGTAVRIAASMIPAGSQCLGVLYRGATTWGNSNGLETLAVGYAENMSRWGRGINRTSGTQTNLGAFAPGNVSASSAIDVWLSSEGGVFDNTGIAVLTAIWQAAQPD